MEHADVLKAAKVDRPALYPGF